MRHNLGFSIETKVGRNKPQKRDSTSELTGNINISLKKRSDGIKQIQSQKMESFVSAFADSMYKYLVYGAGVNSGESHLGQPFYINHGEGIDSGGILVGTSDTPVSIGDSSIETIPNGTESGQLKYLETTVTQDVTVDNDKCSFKFKRRFLNESSDITVRESCLLGYINTIGAGIFARDVLTSPILVSNGDVLEIEYEILINLDPQKSFNMNYINSIYGNFFNQDVSLTFDTGSASVRRGCFPVVVTNGDSKITAEAGTSAWGIAVGSSDNLVVFENYTLGDIIAHGQSAGELNYSECASELLRSDPVTNGSVRSFTIQREYINNSDGVVTAREGGLTTYHGVMILRFLLPESVVLNPGDSMLLTIKMKITV